MAILMRMMASTGLLLGLAAPAQAALVISSDATSNVSCSAGVCSATAADAVLNVGDLITMLAAGSLTVQSGSQAQDILVEAPFSWTSSNALTLDSYRAVTVDRPVSDAGPAALNIAYNDGGTGGELLFRTKGRISFTSTRNALAINGQTYKLVKDIASLASAIAKNASGFYALKDNYNAAKDGTYGLSPITTTFTGMFEGLGNTISNVSLHSGKGEKHQYLYLGLFSMVDTAGSLKNLHLSNIAFVDESVRSLVGAFTGLNKGLLFNDHSTGSITANARVHKYPQFVGAGGVATYNSGTIENCSSDVEIAAKFGDVGGLVDENGTGGTIIASYVTADVKEPFTGDLVGTNDQGIITNSYATGSLTSKIGGTGGLVGESELGAISQSYSIGKVVAAKSRGSAGGFIGEYDSGAMTGNYWDIQTSGADQGTENGNIEGVTGLTTKQFKSALPSGFDSTVWAEDPKINKGYPYLRNNPPAK